MREIKSISFAGGGAMGTTYPGVYLALESSGIFKQLEHIAGSSAGSLVATMLSVGLPAHQFRDLLMKNGIDRLLGDPVDTTSFFKCFSPRSGIPIFEFVNNNMTNEAKAFLQNREELADLRLALQDPTYELTFGDLEALHLLFPEKFKKLTITATRQDTGELEYFTCTSTPDVSVASACQASCAIPSILEKVMIKGKAYFDGGLRNNNPVEVDGIEKEKVLGIDFGMKLNNQNNDVFQALYASRAHEVSNEKQFDALLNNILQALLFNQKQADVRAIVQKQVDHLLLKRVAQVPVSSVEQKELDAFVDMLTDVIKQSSPSSLTTDNVEERCSDIKAVIEPAFYHSKPAVLYLPPPKLYRPGLVDILFRDWFIPTYVPNHGGTNCELKQKTMEKIFSDYALQFIEIRTGHVGTLDFSEGNQFYRVLNAIGFLDAINYLTNHDLTNQKENDTLLFDQEHFYHTFIDNFIAIYKATLVSSGIDYTQDSLLKELLSDKFLSKREQYYFIRESLEIELQFPWYFFYSNIDYALNSPQAFALTRAFEYTNKMIKDDALVEEINARKPQGCLVNLFGLLCTKPKKQNILDELQTIFKPSAASSEMQV